MRPFLPLLLLVACADPAGAPVPGCADRAWHPDRDADGHGSAGTTEHRCDAPPGWVANGGDCDDRDPTVHPGAVEVIDGLDQDCDGVPDDGTVAWDDDGDGACEVAPCTDPTAVGGDCDDADPGRFPGAPERCNGTDDDCDGLPGPLEADGDGDGAPACGDCDDADATRFPGATEACDGRDDDCNGVVDDGDADGDGWIACAAHPGRLDLLIVVADGPGDGPVQERLAADADAVVAALDARGLDWRAGVVATSTGGLHGGFLDGGQTDVADALAMALRRGERAHAPAPLDVAARFLGGAGATWRRPGASLAVWIVTAGDDASDVPLDAVLSALAGAGPAEVVRVSAVSGGPAGCRGDGVDASGARRVAALVEATEGAWASACGSDPFSALGTAWWPPVARDCDDGDARAHPGGVEVCNDVDDDCNGRVDDDADGDGVGPCGGDCDETRPAVHAGAPEACDGLDDDCDGVVPVREHDTDGDGWRVCAGDCADTDPGRHPGAREVCGDGVDANCDGGDGTPGDREDGDGDGYGACDGDCDDDDPTTFPWAPEHASNGRDDDCDGLVDGADPDTVVAFPDATNAWVGGVSSAAPVATFCEVPYRTIRVASDGFVLFGDRSPVYDASPSAAELRERAPALAAGWSDLDPTRWTGGPFDVGAPIAVVRRAGGVATVVWNRVPYARAPGALTAVATMGPGVLEIVVLEGDLDEAFVGYACQDLDFQWVDPDGTMCVDPPDMAAAGAYLQRADALPARLTGACP